MKTRLSFPIAAFIGVLTACLVVASTVAQSAEPTTIYFVRHGEVDMSKPTYPLDASGLKRAQHLVEVLRRVPVTHVFSSHTLRARQAVAAVAESRGLPVLTLPPLDSEVRGVVVTGTSPSKLAVDPLAEALKALAPGSVALVGVNSDNLFGILNRLGVPQGTESDPCKLGDPCVPCLDNSCFPEEFDNLWVLVLTGDAEPPALMWLKY